VIDTHCHLTFKEFAGRTATILADARAVGVRGAITIATTSNDCLNAAAMAEAHDNLWCSAGIHPLHSDEPVKWDDVKRAAASPKCVAWGELGLDNHYSDPPRKQQDKILEEQLAFIQGIEASRDRGIKEKALDSRPLIPGSLVPLMPRPIIVHCRDAFDDLLAVFRTLPSSFDPSRFVFHCFTGTPDDARKVLDFGAMISFTGVVTFQNAREVAEAAKLVSADRIMVETDSPFLTPEPVRKIRPNEPKYVVHVANRIAELRGLNPIDFEKQLDANAERFFGITLPPV
jgi:TatD DNase family protein